MTNSSKPPTSKPNAWTGMTWRQVQEQLTLDPTNEVLVWEAVLHQLQEHRWDGPSFVYMMYSCGRVKIGRTRQVVQVRKRAIRRAINHPVMVMGYACARPDLERSLHAIFRPWCCVDPRPSVVRNLLPEGGPWTKEWFCRTPTLDRLARLLNALRQRGSEAEAEQENPAQGILESPRGWDPTHLETELAKALLGPR